MTRKQIHEMLNSKKDYVDIKKISEALAKARKSSWRESSDKQKVSFSPSIIGFGYGMCSRYWFYAFRGAFFEEKFSPLNASAMKNGILSHQRLQEEYSKAEELKAQIEKECINEDPPIRGFIDVIVEVDGKPVIGDIKTSKHMLYLQREATMKPSPSNYLQTLIYMYVEGVEDGYIHYESKDSHEELLIPIKMTEQAREYIEEVFDWMRTVKKAYEEDTLPERCFTKSEPACKYCPLSKTCWSDESEPQTVIPPLEVKSL